MTLVKSLYSDDPDVIRKHTDLQRHELTNKPGIARAIRPTPSLSPCVHIYTCTGGALWRLDVAPPSAQVVVPNSQQISCLDGSFLECSLPTQEARVRFSARTCQSWDL
jgi:hypothetical protein